MAARKTSVVKEIPVPAGGIKNRLEEPFKQKEETKQEDKSPLKTTVTEDGFAVLE